jgi:alkylation response protein AidB-like acyl-CoA dehydrogenase
VRQMLSQLVIEAQALKVTRLRGLTRRLRGEPPGPEGSILKLFGSELAQRIADASSTLLGPYATIEGATEAVPDAGRWAHRVMGARQYAIAGGTSEIQRNIIGERVLGLPKG